MKVRKTQPNLEAERISPKRAPVLMLVQQESKLSLPIKELQDRIEHLKNMGLIKWAYILHDKDKDKHDKLVAPIITLPYNLKNVLVLMLLPSA